MSTALTGSSNITISLQNKKAIDLSTVLESLSVNYGVTWSYGAGANAANILYHDTVTITDGSNATLNLKDSGSLEDAFGLALTLTAIKLLYLKNTSSDATLKVFGGVSLDLLIVPSTSDIVEVHPGGVFFWVCPTAAGVVVTTNKNLYLVHDGTGSSSMDVDVVILGLD